eukprot:2463703-Rhodomonas_salina.3
MVDFESHEKSTQDLTCCVGCRNTDRCYEARVQSSECHFQPCQGHHGRKQTFASIVAVVIQQRGLLAGVLQLRMHPEF